MRRKFVVYGRSNPANRRFPAVDERIFRLYKSVDKHYIGQELKPKHALLTSIWRFHPERTKSHPAPFPLVLPVRAISSIMDDKKGLIIDPYCGSGTTLVAAKLLGHDYIGIEISKEYVDFAENRIMSCINENKEVTSEMAKHVVTRTFAERKENGEYTGRFKHVKNSSKAEQIPLGLSQQP